MAIPLASDWIGFPTLYYLPVAQTVSEIQEIRGGSSLLYGPEPAPAVNFVTKRPAPGSPWNFYTEQIGGTKGLYQTYNSISEAVGPVEFRLDGAYARSDGQRVNSQYTQWQSNLYLGYRPNEDQLLALDFHAGQFEGGDPGRLTIQQFNADEDQSHLRRSITPGSIVIPSSCVMNGPSPRAGCSRPRLGIPTRISITATKASAAILLSRRRCRRISLTTAASIFVSARITAKAPS